MIFEESRKAEIEVQKLILEALRKKHTQVKAMNEALFLEINSIEDSLRRLKEKYKEEKNEEKIF